LKSFTDPQVVTNLYEFLFSVVEFLNNMGNQTVNGPYCLP